MTSTDPHPATASVDGARVLVVQAQNGSDHGLANALTRAGFDAIRAAMVDTSFVTLVAMAVRSKVRAVVFVAPSPQVGATWLQRLASAPEGRALPVVVCVTESSEELLETSRRERFGIVLVGTPDELRSEVAQVAGHLVTRPEADQGRPRLLVMDDNVAVQALARSVFDRAGFDVTIAARVGDALALLRDEPPFDAAMLDLNLPDGNGFDVLRAIRGQGDAPVVIVSSMGQAHQVERAFELGATDFIEKPFDPRELHARVARHL